MTHRRALQAAPPGPGGYRTLAFGPGENHLLREELCPAAASPGEPLLTVAHLSDIHVCDAQSPARVELLDRWADLDSPIHDLLEEVGTYRAQELLTTQVADAMVRAVNAVAAGPIGGSAPDLAIATGDSTDNAQRNELDWYLALLDGGRVTPDSGDPTRWEGVADLVDPDERYWHPDGGCADLPRSRHGFPLAPGLLDAVRAPFDAAGLAVPWLAVHGNHDRLVQGTIAAEGPFGDLATGSAKLVGLPDGLDAARIAELIADLADCAPDALALMARGRFREVTPDARRRIVSRAEFVAAHDRPAARPPRHGFPADGRPYYRHDVGAVSLLVLDTVNPYGGWEGSLDRDQFAWLQGELLSADGDGRYAVLASHHPLSTLVNAAAPPGDAPRVLGPELLAELRRHRSFVLWLNGHTHETTITAGDSWWEVTAPSLIDWPQQGRIVEVLRADGVLTIATTMLDHAGEAPWQGGIGNLVELAGLSRELAANDWQWLTTGLHEHPRGGSRLDRNVLLTLKDPFH